MTSFAHPSSKPLKGPPPATGSDTRNRSNDNTLSVAKLSLIGSLGAALLASVTTIYLDNTDPEQKGPPLDSTTTSTPFTPVTVSPLVSVNQVMINDSESEVTVAGSVTGNVERVLVTIGPRQSGGQYWAASANVKGQHWQLVVDTDPHLVRPYEITAVPKNPTEGGFSGYAFDATTPPPAPPGPAGPDQDVNCAEQNGDSCFTGPGWGPPSVYQGD